MVERNNNDTRYAVDIRVFVTVIVVAMAVSFGIGVGLGPSGGRAEVMTVPAATPLPPVTSVQVAESGDFPPDDDLHEPAGQVRCLLSGSVRSPYRFAHPFPFNSSPASHSTCWWTLRESRATFWTPRNAWPRPWSTRSRVLV